MSHLSRREFVFRSTALAGRAIVGFVALDAVMTRSASGTTVRPTALLGDGGYGPLRKAGPELELPEGFSYTVIGVEGSPMTDGNPTPGRHDGMCAFPLPNGNIRLIRNHELEDPPRVGVTIGSPNVAYDRGAAAGCTSLEIQPETREVIRDFVSLNGTFRNCAGGPTPWGSWLSCEEAFFGPESGFAEYHGYVFEVPVTREELAYTEPIIALGRFVHEAVAVDPSTGIVYQTEDHFKAGFYRFLPNEPYGPGKAGDLRAGGSLQMLGIRDRSKYDTAKRQRRGRSLPVTWVDIAEPNPLVTPAEFSAVFDQGTYGGGARFSRLEGCFYHDGAVYFVATDGGDRELGQIWEYRPSDSDDGTLTLIFESRSKGTLKRPDNICVSPRGAIVMCEDANERRQYVRGLTQDGKVFDIAAPAENDRELAGATFSPDGQTLFFNIQGNREKKHAGMTFAVWGPWERGAI